MADDQIKDVTEPTTDEHESRRGLVAHVPESGNGRASIRLHRRSLLIGSAATGVTATAASLGLAGAQETTPATPPTTVEEGVTQVATVTAEHHEMGAQATTGATQGGFTYFVPFQAAIIEAAAARLIPTDDLGPGATEAGVVYFIDRQLFAERHAYYGYRGWRYGLGPFQAGENTQGDQSALPMSERFRLGILGMEAHAQRTFGDGFVALSPEQQDQVLRDMENGNAEPFGGASIVSPPSVPAPEGVAIDAAGQSGISGEAFFDLLQAYTFAGFFADPIHGGNRDMVGWKLIGFPGAQMGYADWILRYGETFDGSLRSLADYQTQVSGGS